MKVFALFAVLCSLNIALSAELAPQQGRTEFHSNSNSATKRVFVAYFKCLNYVPVVVKASVTNYQPSLPHKFKVTVEDIDSSGFWIELERTDQSTGWQSYLIVDWVLYFEASWSNWQAWSECSVTCGRGVTRRTRQCITDMADSALSEGCVGRSVDSMICNEKDCPVFHGCKDALRTGHNKSGIYSIYNPRNNQTLKVYCDQSTDDGGWLVFQRRTDGSENFYRTWAEYQEMFGNLNNEFWLGMENLHALTNNKDCQLRIELEDCENVTKFAKFTSFAVGSVDEDYSLKVSGYSGNAGDSLSYHNGRSFTTKDVDNDSHLNNCAVLGHGAWWYVNCFHSNLNGAYLNCQTTTYEAASWKTFRGTKYSLKFIEMKLRPI